MISAEVPPRCRISPGLVSGVYRGWGGVGQPSPYTPIWKTPTKTAFTHNIRTLYKDFRRRRIPVRKARSMALAASYGYQRQARRKSACEESDIHDSEIAADMLHATTANLDAWTLAPIRRRSCSSDQADLFSLIDERTKLSHRTHPFTKIFDPPRPVPPATAQTAGPETPEIAQ